MNKVLDNFWVWGRRLLGMEIAVIWLSCGRPGSKARGGRVAGLVVAEPWLSAYDWQARCRAKWCASTIVGVASRLWVARIGCPENTLLRHCHLIKRPC